MNYIHILNTDQVTIMRALRIHKPQVYTARKLCQIFHVSKSCAEKAISGRSWKWLQFPIQPYASEIAEEFINGRLK